jgi:hypothetical protein
MIDVESEVNSTKTALTGNASFTGGFEYVAKAATIKITGYANVPGTLYVDFSNNGSTTLHSVQLTDGTSGNFKTVYISPQADFAKVRVVNGAVAQTTFYLRTIYCGRIRHTLDRLTDSINGYVETIIAKAILYGKTSLGDYVALLVNTSGHLSTRVENTVQVSGTVTVDDSTPIDVAVTNTPSVTVSSGTITTITNPVKHLLIEFLVNRDGAIDGKTAYIIKMMGRRSLGWTSTTLLEDVCNYLNTSQARKNDVVLGTTYYLVSTSANDDGDPVGTGARTVAIVYLDGSGNLQTTTVTMNGTTPVSLGNQISYFEWMEVESVGSNTTAVGDISITSNNGAASYANTVSRITAGGNRSLDGNFKVPTGYAGYILDWSAASIGSATQDVRLRSTTNSLNRAVGTVYHFEDTMFIPGNTQGDHRDMHYLKLPAGAEIKISSISGNVAANNRVDAPCHILLVAI